MSPFISVNVLTSKCPVTTLRKFVEDPEKYNTRSPEYLLNHVVRSYRIHQRTAICQHVEN